MSLNDYPCLIENSSEKRFVLKERIITIGGEKSCTIKIPVDMPRAAHLIYSGGGYSIQSLASGQQVKVNSEKIRKKHKLTQGDEISVIGNRFVFYERKPDKGGGDKKKDMPFDYSVVEDLIGIVVSLLKNRNQDVCKEIVASVSNLLKCDAARLVSEEDENGSLRTIARYPGGTGLDRFSSRAIEWAKDSPEAVLVNESDWHETEKPEASLEKNLVASVICVQLKENDRSIGFLYCDRLQSNEPFSEKERTFCDILAPLFSEIIITTQEHRRQQDTIAKLQSKTESQSTGMIFEGSPMQEITQQARTFAGTDSPVLITGETGTGKELMARFIHDNSPRRTKEIRTVNCGAIPESLMESELFGHEKGAFTGASGRKPGIFETAEGGSIFLDEIGELPLSLQVKMLRFLQNSEIIRVGGIEPFTVDVRIIAATNRDLEKDVAQGNFRQDLFYRLNVLSVVLPPIRERGEDIILLAEYFIGKYCSRFGVLRKKLSLEARNVLRSYTWPGNIRELENVVQKIVLTVPDERVEADMIPIPGVTDENRTSAAGVILTLKEAREEVEKKVIEQALGNTEGNISRAARKLDIDRKWLMKKMENLNISADTYRK